jgi:hypothetical protein
VGQGTVADEFLGEVVVEEIATVSAIGFIGPHHRENSRQGADVDHAEVAHA